ncbi:MAG: SelB C-terminal domain-containing protein [Acidimicrobiales bacterium]
MNLSDLSQHQRNIVDLLSDVVVEGNYLRREGEDNLAEHDFLEELKMNLFKPPEPTSVGKPELRELVRRGLVIEEGGIYFSPKAIEEATTILALMLQEAPEGITVGEVREELKTTRKYILPLLAYLDNSGITVRRGDVRLAGKRMPDTN